MTTTTPTAAARVSGTIKALEWGDEPETSCAVGAGAEYLVELSHNGSWYWEDAGPFDTIDAAKAAAQAEFKDRILAAIQPDHEPSARDALQVIADIPSTMNGSFDHGLEVAYRAVEALFDNPPMITCTPTEAEPKRDSDRQPWDATPSSAGTVSVEAARPMSDVPEDGTWVLLYPGYYGPVTACTMNGEWTLFNDAEKPHVTHWVEIQPALRALAGEGER